MTYLKIFRDLLFCPSRTEASFLLFHAAWFVGHYSSSSLFLRRAIASVESGQSVFDPVPILVDGPMALPGYSLRGRGVKTTTGLFIDTEATAPFPLFGIRRNPQCWDLRFTPLQGLAKLRRRSPDIGYASFSRDDAACLLARRNRVISLEKTPSHRCVKQSLEFLIECISPRLGVANPAINDYARTENYVPTILILKKIFLALRKWF